MYRKYFVYLDGGENIYKIVIVARSEDAAIAWVRGIGGAIAAMKDVTDNYPVNINRDYIQQVNVVQISVYCERDTYRALSEFEAEE